MTAGEMADAWKVLEGDPVDFYRLQAHSPICHPVRLALITLSLHTGAHASIATDACL
jgi:hypothetical protein